MGKFTEEAKQKALAYHKNKGELSRNQYNQSPNRCKFCKNPIYCTGDNCYALAAAKEKKFCNSSCAVKYNNLGKIRNAKGINGKDIYLDIYDWKSIQKFHDLGHETKECLQQFNISRYIWNKAVRQKKLERRFSLKLHNRLSPQERLNKKLIKGRYWNTKQLKIDLIKAGLFENKCYRCGIVNWQDEAIIIQLHHIDGDNTNNLLENLTLLCPNCHSQTPNYGNKNRNN